MLKYWDNIVRYIVIQRKNFEKFSVSSSLFIFIVAICIYWTEKGIDFLILVDY